MPKKKGYIIFGAGYEGKNILNALGNDRVVFFCDNAIQGDVCGISVIDFNRLKEIYTDYEVIIGVQRKEAREQIEKQLMLSGIEYIYPSRAYEEVGIDSTKVKHDSELDFWRSVNIVGQNRDETDAHYRNIILSIADEKDEAFLQNKVVADFGCGPRGSLNWIKNSMINIGIDVLAPQYTKEFGEEIIKQRMLYVTSGEKFIPIPDNTIDCLITMNSLDHVSDLEAMCNEITRIMKPKALLVGSFNLFEPATSCEPQSLTEELLKVSLFCKFNVINYRIAYKGRKNPYERILAKDYVVNPDDNKPCLLWVTATKK